MIVPVAEIVENGDLWQSVVVAVVAGVSLTVLFSIAIWGATRFADLSRDDRPAAAAAAVIVSAVAGLATVTAVIVAIVFMAME